MLLPFHQKTDCPLLLLCCILYTKQPADDTKKTEEQTLPRCAVLTRCENEGFSLHTITNHQAGRKPHQRARVRQQHLSPELCRIPEHSQQQSSSSGNPPPAIPSTQGQQDKQERRRYSPGAEKKLDIHVLPLPQEPGTCCGRSGPEESRHHEPTPGAGVRGCPVVTPRHHRQPRGHGQEPQPEHPAE